MLLVSLAPSSVYDASYVSNMCSNCKSRKKRIYQLRSLAYQLIGHFIVCNALRRIGSYTISVPRLIHSNVLITTRSIMTD